jgi:D-glycero-D-manno-heptose 1,7-bisphosphate phosphatase
MRRRPALFLDRDGIVNVDHGYVHRVDQVQFVDGIFELCRTAQQRGYLPIVVSNQAGIGRGFYSEDDFHSLMDWMKAEFAVRGLTIADVLFCPDHPEHGIGVYRRHSPMRKPEPGMILAAAARHDLDLGRSVLVGDKPSDVAAGAAAGVAYNVLVSSTRPPALPDGTLVMRGLVVVARWLATLPT